MPPPDSYQVRLEHEQALLHGRQRLVDRPAKGVIFSQYNYDFQPVLQDGLSTLESGLATNETVEAAAGDMVYNTAGEPVALEEGVVVFDKDGNEVTFDGATPVTMKQLAVTYKMNPFTWSDGTPGVILSLIHISEPTRPY